MTQIWVQGLALSLVFPLPHSVSSSIACLSASAFSHFLCHLGQRVTSYAPNSLSTQSLGGAMSYFNLETCLFEVTEFFIHNIMYAY